MFGQNMVSPTNAHLSAFKPVSPVSASLANQNNMIHMEDKDTPMFTVQTKAA